MRFWPELYIEMASISGIVFDIQRAAIHDGPGIRSVVFLKGCPLRCKWCHNPESQRLECEIGKSGKCYGERFSVEEIIAVVCADRAYYSASGGGLTLSGGEPTFQLEFCRALLEGARAEGINTCLDTCGHCSTKELLELHHLVDVWLFDYKATGARLHKRLTGVDGALIGRNLEALRLLGANIHLRCPIVPGENDTPEHLDLLRNWETEKPRVFSRVERLPYHATGSAKYADLNRPVPTIRSK